MTTDPIPLLREALAAVAKATPGKFAGHARRDGSFYVSAGDYRSGAHVAGDVHLPYEEIDAMVAAVNWMRDHGDALLARLAGEGCKTLDEWHEDFGPVVWWRFPVEEPAHIGTPTDDDWPGYHTHWTPHPSIPAPPALAPAPKET